MFHYALFGHEGGIRNFVFEAYLSEEEEICRRTEGMSMMGRKIG
jgi:hypothetical protein